MKVLKSVHRVEALTERRRMRYVAFGLVVLLGVVGQANAGRSWFSRKKTTTVQPANNDGVPTAQTATGQPKRSWVGRMADRVTGKSKTVVAIPSNSMALKMQNSDAEGMEMESPADMQGDADAQQTAIVLRGKSFKRQQSGLPTGSAMSTPMSAGNSTPLLLDLDRSVANVQPSKVAPAPTTWQKFKQVVVPGQKARDLYAAGDHAGGQAATNKSRLGRFMKKTASADLDTGKQTSYLNKKYLGMSTADHRFFRNTRDGLSSAAKRVGAGFGQLKTALTPGERATKMVNMLRTKRSIATSEIKRLERQHQNTPSDKSGSLEVEIARKKEELDNLETLFTKAKRQLTNMKKRLTPESGLLGQAATAWRNRGKAPGEREKAQNPGFFGGLRAKRKAAKDAAAEAAAAAAAAKALTVQGKALTVQGKALTVPGEDVVTEKQDLALLGLSPGASRKEIKAAFRRAVLETHPDKAGNSPEAVAAFRRVTQARDALLKRDTNTSEQSVLMLQDVPPVRGKQGQQTAQTALSVSPPGGTVAKKLEAAGLTINYATLPTGDVAHDNL